VSHRVDSTFPACRNYLESIPFEACPDFDVAYVESEDVVGYTGACPGHFVGWNDGLNESINLAAY